MKARARVWAAAEEGRNADDYRPDMPPVSGAEYLLDYLFEIGPTMHGGMGPARLTNEELLAWQINSGIRLSPWDCRCLVRLSGEFLVEAQKAQQRDAVPPWSGEVSDDELRAVASGLRAAISRMAA